MTTQRPDGGTEPAERKAPVTMPESIPAPARQQKIAKPPKPRKVEKRQRGRKG